MIARVPSLRRSLLSRYSMPNLHHASPQDHLNSSSGHTTEWMQQPKPPMVCHKHCRPSEAGCVIVLRVDWDKQQQSHMTSPPWPRFLTYARPKKVGPTATIFGFVCCPPHVGVYKLEVALCGHRQSFCPRLRSWIYGARQLPPTAYTQSASCSLRRVCRFPLPSRLRQFRLLDFAFCG